MNPQNDKIDDASPVQTVTQETCNEGWSHFQGRCYKMIQERKTFNEAAQHCPTLGENGELARIHGQETDEFIKSLYYFNQFKNYIMCYIILLELTYRYIRKCT